MRNVGPLLLVLAALAAGGAAWVFTGSLVETPPDLMLKFKVLPASPPFVHFKFVMQTYGHGRGSEFCSESFDTAAGVPLSKTLTTYASSAAAQEALRRMVAGGQRVNGPTTCGTTSDRVRERALMVSDYRDRKPWYGVTWREENKLVSIESPSLEEALAFEWQLCLSDEGPVRHTNGA